MVTTSSPALKPGTRIESFEIREILGAGGFGITYKAWDHQLLCDVAIKEFLPHDVAVRAEDKLTVTARTHADQDQEGFESGLEKFLAEARTLARFRNPNVVSVKQFVTANGTAYLIMDYEQGISLAERIKSGDEPIPESQLRDILERMLVGLKDLHEQKILHRDIKPANIFLRANGEPVLLDFGSARETPRDRGAEHEMTSMVSLGYAPYEQYNRRGNQGPWTDLYSLGATLYYCATGKKPVDGMDRYIATKDGWPDPMPAASDVAKGRYDPLLLGIIDWMLQVEIKDRPRDSAQVMAVLAGEAPLPERQQADDDRTVVRGGDGDTVLLDRGDSGRTPGSNGSVGLGQKIAGLVPVAALRTHLATLLADLRQGKLDRRHAIAGGVIALLILLLLPLWASFRINSAVPKAITAMSQLGAELGTEVDDVDVSLLGRSLVLHGLRVANPEGYQSTYMLTAENVTIEFADRFWWWRDSVTIDNIRISAPQISYERNPNTGRSNLAGTSTLKPVEAEATEPGHKYAVQTVTMEEGELQAVSFPRSDEIVTKSIPKLTLSDIGKETPLSGAQLFGVLAKDISDSAVEAAKSSAVIRRATATRPASTAEAKAADKQGASADENKGGEITDKLKSFFSAPPSEVFDRKEDDF
jgi:serine/threonine protein kinase